MKDGKTDQSLITLGDATLHKLPPNVARPTYDRSGLTPGMVHIGLGNFHRAHQAWFLHELMQRGLAHDWAILGAGVRSGDIQMQDRLVAQDCLTTLVELDPSGTSAEVTGSMIDFLPVEAGNAALIAAMSDPAIRIVSLTVTEGGYFIGSSGGFDSTHPDIQHDVQNPSAPITAFGAIVAALKVRREAGVAPFTCLCCDNLQNNGAVLRQTVVGLAALSDHDLADWIDTRGAFPNAMVDCIVPATGDAELALVQSLGIDDAAPVTHENFRQWVIEDKFCNGRPPWEKVGVTLTDDVHPFESMKIRVLNAGHQVLANAGELLGLETISDCMADPDLLAFFRKIETEEILPHVDPVPNTSAVEYLALIESRFANPRIKDTTRRVAFDGSSRHPGFVLPVLGDALQKGQDVSGLALVEALWCHMCAGVRDDGTEIAANDPMWDDLNACALAARDNPDLWLGQTQIYGQLSDSTAFKTAFTTALKALMAKGTRAVLKDFLAA